jgi:uncharacterized protein YecE (DUF72 family)
MPRPSSTDTGRNAGSILVGTASWTDPTLIKCGRFYPPEINTAEARLRYYAGEFPLVEVDSTYYALPSARNAVLWAKRTPKNFLFDVKAFRLLTQHQTEPKFLPPAVRNALGAWDKQNVYYDDLPNELLDEIWREFEAGLAPLAAAGKLGALLFQFPRWFVMRRASFDHIREIRRRLPDYSLAIEFRHESWFSNSPHRNSTLDFLRQLGVTNVTVDEPQGLPGSIPALWEVTNPKLAMLRLHGRNAVTWNKRDLPSAAQRFDYDYAEKELADFVPQLRELATSAAVVHVICNVNKQDQGVRAARTMRRLLGQSQGRIRRSA